MNARLHSILIATTLMIHSATATTDVLVRYESFQWKEYGLDGEQLLEETGYRVGAIWNYESRYTNTLDWSTRTLLYLGDVDYDGQTQLGEPVESTTGYYGLQLDGACYYPIHLTEQFHAAPFVGLGVDSWLRQLDNTGGLTDRGYDEWWLSTFVQAGARLRWVLPRSEWFAKAGIRYPFWMRAEYDLVLPDGTDNASVTPEGDVAWFSEIGFRHASVVVSFFYEETAYKKSEFESVGIVDIYQPESKQRSTGLQVGVSF